MKIVEVMGGILMPITNEESDVLEKFRDLDSVDKRNLTEREQVLVNQLVLKNVLYRKHKDGQIEYFKQPGYRESS